MKNIHDASLRLNDSPTYLAKAFLKLNYPMASLSLRHSWYSTMKTALEAYYQLPIKGGWWWRKTVTYLSLGLSKPVAVSMKVLTHAEKLAWSWVAEWKRWLQQTVRAGVSRLLLKTIQHCGRFNGAEREKKKNLGMSIGIMVKLGFTVSKSIYVCWC